MCSTACWSSDARSPSTSPDPERGWGECARTSGPCNTLLDAIDWMRRTGDEGRRVIRPEKGVLIKGVVPPKWRDLILEIEPAGGMRLNWTN